MPLFDAYIFIDWSASNRLGRPTPAPDNVWIGAHIPHQDYSHEEYCRSRSYCIEYVVHFLRNEISKKHRVLIGFDFPYGYPKGLSNALGYDNDLQLWSTIWKELYDNIKDTNENISNRFEVANDLNFKVSAPSLGPFWGHPVGQIWPNLRPNSPGFPFHSANELLLKRLRLVESRIGGLQETWKLFGAGSVGSQALVGIPKLHYLRHHIEFGQYSKVWPFETHFTPTPTPEKGPFILHSEIWPGIVSFDTEYILSEGKTLIKDQLQVRAMCHWASRLDEKGELGEYFSTPRGLTDGQIQDCVEHEGWILGVC
jgi:hypothetical protein